MVATLTTPRPATALAPHRPGRMARVGRLAFGVMFAGGAAVHDAIVITGTETYRHFADRIHPVRQAGMAVVVHASRGVVRAAAGRL
jgi:hypothetical protein